MEGSQSFQAVNGSQSFQANPDTLGTVIKETYKQQFDRLCKEIIDQCGNALASKPDIIKNKIKDLNKLSESMLSFAFVSTYSNLDIAKYTTSLLNKYSEQKRSEQISKRERSKNNIDETTNEAVKKLGDSSEEQYNNYIGNESDFIKIYREFQNVLKGEKLKENYIKENIFPLVKKDVEESIIHNDKIDDQQKKILLQVLSNTKDLEGLDYLQGALNDADSAKLEIILKREQLIPSDINLGELSKSADMFTAHDFKQMQTLIDVIDNPKSDLKDKKSALAKLEKRCQDPDSDSMKRIEIYQKAVLMENLKIAKKEFAEKTLGGSTSSNDYIAAERFKQFDNLDKVTDLHELGKIGTELLAFKKDPVLGILTEIRKEISNINENYSQDQYGELSTRYSWLPATDSYASEIDKLTEKLNEYAEKIEIAQKTNDPNLSKLIKEYEENRKNLTGSTVLRSTISRPLSTTIKEESKKTFHTHPDHQILNVNFVNRVTNKVLNQIEDDFKKKEDLPLDRVNEMIHDIVLEEWRR